MYYFTFFFVSVGSSALNISVTSLPSDSMITILVCVYVCVLLCANISQACKLYTATHWCRTKLAIAGAGFVLLLLFPSHLHPPIRHEYKPSSLSLALAAACTPLLRATGEEVRGEKAAGRRRSSEVQPASRRTGLVAAPFSQQQQRAAIAKL